MIEMLKTPSKKLIDSFIEWYEKDPHSKQEDAYSGKITKEDLSGLNKEQFINFFSDFSLEGGKVQSGGKRTYKRFTDTISGNQYEDFRKFVLSSFESGFDASQWLEQVKSFKHFGEGLATIFLNRVDKKRFVIVNKKSQLALKKLGIKKFPVDISKRFELVHEAQTQLLSWFPSLDNFYRVDALMHYIAGVDEGIKLVQDWLENEKNINSPNPPQQSTGAKMPLNQILYGPPGTGKTYHSISKAVGICRSDDDEFPRCKQHEAEGHQKDCYACAETAYKQLQEEGRIEFVTFHQSYGYEEFIEGVRAETNETDNGESVITYEVKPGVLRRLAKKASATDATRRNFDEIFKETVIDTVLAQGKPLEITTKRGHFLIKEISENSIFFDKQKGDSKHSLAIRTLKRIYEDGENKIIVGGLQTYYEALLKYLNDHAKEVKPKQEQPYVLIIDEINRGNISKIFGELITLIEDDKRLGNDHPMTARLPVSGDEFGVPKNLYIIGTMNTADRSIAMMDTALRRRFEFEEMMPEPERLKGVAVDGVDIATMLETMNKRIEVLYDREHTIGHAYFMNLGTDSTIDDLEAIFRNKVIPLLAEYFFEDWEKIRMVLGDDQKENEKHQFVTESKKHDFKALFGSESNNFSGDAKTCVRNSGALTKPESYIGIYEPKASGEEPKTEQAGESDEVQG